MTSDRKETAKVFVKCFGTIKGAEVVCVKGRGRGGGRVTKEKNEIETRINGEGQGGVE